MASIAGIPPEALKDVLIENGWEIIDETENMWLLAKGPKGEPLPIPKHCDEVDPEIMDAVAHQTGLSGPIHRAVQKHVAPTP